MHHIDDYAKVQEHQFDNLILLCATCHARVTKKEIDRQSVLQYKANLSVMNQRYGDFERRVLEWFADGHWDEALRLDPTSTVEISIRYLVQDGLVNYRPQSSGMFINGAQVAGIAVCTLTNKGREFVTRWIRAEEIA